MTKRALALSMLPYNDSLFYWRKLLVTMWFNYEAHLCYIVMFYLSLQC